MIKFHKKFNKAFKKLRLGERAQFIEKLQVFAGNPFDPILNNHKLHGEHADKRSINITGDLRALYQIDSNGDVRFTMIDTHSNLYE